MESVENSEVEFARSTEDDDDDDDVESGGNDAGEAASDEEEEAKGEASSPHPAMGSARAPSPKTNPRAPLMIGEESGPVDMGVASTPVAGPGALLRHQHDASEPPWLLRWVRRHARVAGL